MLVIVASTKKNLGKWSLFFLAWGNGQETFHENTIWGRIENYPFSFVWYLIFNPNCFFMKSFISSLFYVFLASISLFFSFLIFSNSFSFRFRNNTACTHNTRFLCFKIYSSRTSVSYVPFLMLWEGEGARRYFIMREGNFWNVHGWATGLACQYDNKNNVFVCSLIVNLIYTVFMVKFKRKFHKCTFTNMREIWKYVKS